MKKQNFSVSISSDTKHGKIYFENYKPTKDINESIVYCLKQIKLLKNKKKFYIGATHNHKKRLEEHMKEKKMYNMFVLTHIKTKINTIKIEQELIKYYCDDKNISNDIYIDHHNNLLYGGGGEGIIYETNYIYVLFK